MNRVLAIALAALLQLGGLAAAHFYYGANPGQVLVVVDSSFGLKEHQSAIERWIDRFETKQRYSVVHFGTDKSYLGVGDGARQKLYRVSFGSMSPDRLETMYPAEDYQQRYLLTFTGQSPDGWNSENFATGN